MTTTSTRVGIASAIRDYGTYRRTLRELAWLSDRDLSDMGISRADLRSTARASAYER